MPDEKQNKTEDFISILEGDYESHLFFTGTLNPASAFALSNNLYGLDLKYREDLVKSGNMGFNTKETSEATPVKVVLHLTCRGGTLTDAFAIADIINSISIPIDCIIEGVCAASAIVVALACRNRAMLSHARICLSESYHSAEMLKTTDIKSFTDEANRVQQEIYAYCISQAECPPTLHKQLKAAIKNAAILNEAEAIKFGLVNSSVHQIL